MAHSKESSTRPELLFLDYDIDELKGPNLPTIGDMLRYYFNRRHALPNKSSHQIVLMILDECIKIWKNNEIPTTKKSNGVASLEKIIREFNDMKTNYKSANEIQRQNMMTMWRRKYKLMYSIATLNAHEECSVENRKKLLAAKDEIREFNRAVKKGTLANDEKKVRSEKKSSKVSQVEKAKVNGDDNNNNNANEEPEKKKAKIGLKPSEIIDICGSDDGAEEKKAKNNSEVEILEMKINNMDCDSLPYKRLRSGKMVYSELNLKETNKNEEQSPKKTSDTDDDNNNIDLVNQMKSGTKPALNGKATPKVLKQWHDDKLPFYSPNQNLREKLKQQGWVYTKKNPAWKLAIVAPPSKFFD